MEPIALIQTIVSHPISRTRTTVFVARRNALGMSKLLVRIDAMNDEPSPAQDLLTKEAYDESRSASRLHDPRLRLRHRQVPRGGDEPRSRLRRRKGTSLRQPRTPAESHGFSGKARHGLASRLHQKSLLDRRRQVRPINARVSPGRNIWAMSVLLKPYAIVPGRRGPNRFFLSDCVDVFRHLQPQSVDVIVTSPPYNLGIRYNQYQDTLSQADYLEWTHTWVAAAARVLRPDGSLFLNVGAKPSDPWTALDVAQAVRSHLRLQNIIHWIKSIAIERELAGANAGLERDLAVGHYKPINSDRFLNDCHEFVFHFTPAGTHPARSARARRPVPGSVEHRPLARRRRRRALPRQHVVHPVRDDPAARPRSAASGDVPVAGFPSSACACTGCRESNGDGSVHGAGQHGGRLRAARRELHRMRYRRDLSVAGGRADAGGRARPGRRRQAAGQGPARRTEGQKSYCCFVAEGGRRRRLQHVFLSRPDRSSPASSTATSTVRRRFRMSGFFE